MSIYKIAHRASFNGLNVMMQTHHYEFNGYVPSPAELQSFIDNMDAIYKTYFQARLTPKIEVLTYTARRVDLGGLPEAFITPTAGLWVGTGSGDSLPSWIGVLTTWKAPTTFPRTSRTYGFAPNEGQNNNNGEPDTGILGDALSAGTDLLSIAVSGQDPASKIAVHYETVTNAVTDFNNLTTVSVSSYWGTQRRRRVGVGS